MSILEVFKNNKKFKKLKREALDNPAQTMSFLDEIFPLALNPLASSDFRKKCKQFYGAIRRKFIELSFEKFIRLLELQEAYHQEHKHFLNIFFGTKYAERDQAKKVINYILNQANKAGIDITVDAHLQEKTARIYLLMNNVMYTPTDITYTWYNLIESVIKKDPEAIVLFKYWLQKFFLVSRNYVVVPNYGHSFNDIIPELQKQFKDSTVRIPVHPDHYEFVKDFVEKQVKELLEEQERHMAMLRWFHSQLHSFQKAADTMWNELSFNAKYGLRKSGLDRVKIEMQGLKDLGYKNFQLIPDDCTFPTIRIRFWIENNISPMSYHIPLDSSGLFFTNQQAVLDGDLYYVMDALLKYVAMASYYEIVTGKRPPRTIKQSNPTPRPPVYPSGPQASVFPTLRRPHFRNLPIGHQASEQALQRSENIFGYRPPVGKTFVRESEVGMTQAQLHAAMLSTKPLFTYTDSDLGYTP